MVNYLSILLIVHPAILHIKFSYYACIFQDKAYWEVKVQQDGIWSIGIATPSADLNKDLGLDSCSWALTHTGLVRTRGHQVGHWQVLPASIIFLPCHRLLISFTNNVGIGKSVSANCLFKIFLSIKQ